MEVTLIIRWFTIYKTVGSAMNYARILILSLVLLAVTTAFIAYFMFSQGKPAKITAAQTEQFISNRSITIVSSKTYAQEYKRLDNNEFYILCSTKGGSYYGKLVLKITPPLKKENYIVVNVSSNIGTISLTLAYSRKVFDVKTGVSLYPNWLNIQVANYLNNTYRLTGANEIPPIKPLNMVFNMSRYEVTIVNLDTGEKLTLYTNINKTLESYVNRSDIINLGYESLVEVYGDTFTTYLTVSNTIKPVPLADTLQVELAYPEEWLNQTPWIKVSVEKIG